MKRIKTKSLTMAIFAVFLMSALICYLDIIPSLASSGIDSRKQQQQEVKNQLGEVRGEMEGAISEGEELEGTIVAIDNIKKQSEMTHNELLDLLALYEEEISNANLALIESEEQFNEQEAQLKARIRNMYMNSNTSTLDVLLGSDGLVSFMEKMELYSAISKYDSEVLENYRNSHLDLEHKRSIQLLIAQDTQVLANEAQREIETLETDRAAVEERLAKAQENIDKLQKQEDELEAKSAQLEKEIKELTAKLEEERLQEERQRAARQQAERQQAEKQQAEKQQAATYNGGSMKWPVPGNTRITSNFGNRMHPIYKVMKRHTGIDIGAPKGANIVAAKGGTVIVAGWQGGYGNTAVIDHGGGITTLYGHCSKLLVKKGDKVKEGATIAKVGSTGTSTGNHLHFEVRSNGNPVNPIPKYISR